METVSTEKAPSAIGPYSQAVVSGSFVYTSGQIAIDPETGCVVEGGIREQTEQICKNLSELLKASGCDVTKVVKTTCFITDMNDFAAFNEVYAKYFTSRPARSCVEVSALPKGVLAEIEVVAEK